MYYEKYRLDLEISDYVILSDGTVCIRWATLCYRT